jgi:hypothetical protein
MAPGLRATRRKESLRAPDVTGFVIRHAHQLSPVRAGIMVTALRSFFRYLLHRGAITTDLAECVPTVPNWSLSTLPSTGGLATLPAVACEVGWQTWVTPSRLCG